MDKIKKILCCELDDLDVYLELKMAFEIKNYRESQKDQSLFIVCIHHNKDYKDNTLLLYCFFLIIISKEKTFRNKRTGVTL